MSARQQLAELARDGREDLVRRRILGDERGDAPERALRLGERAPLLLDDGQSPTGPAPVRSHAEKATR